MLLSKITYCLFFCILFLGQVIDSSALSRADAGVVKCRLRCLRAPSNRTTIPAHISWLGLNFVINRNYLSERERTDYIKPMLNLSKLLIFLTLVVRRLCYWP